MVITYKWWLWVPNDLRVLWWHRGQSKVTPDGRHYLDGWHIEESDIFAGKGIHAYSLIWSEWIDAMVRVCHIPAIPPSEMHTIPDIEDDIDWEDNEEDKAAPKSFKCPSCGKRIAINPSGIRKGDCQCGWRREIACQKCGRIPLTAQVQAGPNREYMCIAKKCTCGHRTIEKPIIPPARDRLVSQYIEVLDWLSQNTPSIDGGNKTQEYLPGEYRKKDLRDKMGLGDNARLKDYEHQAVSMGFSVSPGSDIRHMKVSVDGQKHLGDIRPRNNKRPK